MIILKAGGIVVRRQNGVVELLCVHRARNQDWSFPKGHIELGEHSKDAALREVLEETGLRCHSVRTLPVMEYELPNADTARVFMYEMSVDAEDAEAKDDEVDEMRWCAQEECMQLLSYDTLRTYIEKIVL